MVVPCQDLPACASTCKHIKAICLVMLVPCQNLPSASMCQLLPAHFNHMPAHVNTLPTPDSTSQHMSALASTCQDLPAHCNHMLAYASTMPALASTLHSYAVSYQYLASTWQHLPAPFRSCQYKRVLARTCQHLSAYDSTCNNLLVFCQHLPAPIRLSWPAHCYHMQANASAVTH